MPAISRELPVSSLLRKIEIYYTLNKQKEHVEFKSQIGVASQIGVTRHITLHRADLAQTVLRCVRGTVNQLLVSSVRTAAPGAALALRYKLLWRDRNAEFLVS